jgi:outer membrane protein OmpU
MNNLKKVGLTALAGALVSVSANAADLSVTGGASISFAGEEKQLTGNGWSMNNGVTFSASVEQDNGWNITATQVLNDDDVETSHQVFDTRSVAIDMGDTGTLTFYGTGGSGAVSAIDDTTPTAGEESWDDVTGADVAPSGPTGNNMFHYTKDMSNMLDGLSVTASFTPSDKAVEIESSSDYAVKYTGIEGLTVGFGQGEDNGEGATASVETDVIYANFATEMGISVGYTASEADSNATNADKEMTAMGISYAMSEDVSVSYNISEIEFENSTLSDQEATGISVSYTMGSLSIKANHNTVDNIAGTSTDDRSGYALTLGFTF